MFNVIVLGIASLLTDISSEMVYPVLPVFLVTTLGASPAILGLIEGIAESLASLLKLFSGYFSDKFKSRKSFTILGYGASTAGKLFLFFAGSWSWVLVGRIIDRFGKGVRTAPRDALIAESSPEGKRGAAFGLHRSLDTLGACIGIIAAFFFVLDYKGDLRVVFLFSLIPATLGVIFLFFVREKRVRAAEAKPLPRLSWKALDRKLQLFLIFTFLFTLGNSSNQFLLLRAKDLGGSVSTVILFYLAYNVIYFLFSYPAAKLSDKIGRKNILVAGYLCYGLVYLGFALNRSLPGCWLLFATYGLYMGFTDGVEKALVTDMAPRELRATFIGLHATLVGVGLLPASLFAGLLWKYIGPSAAFYFGATMGIVASIGLFFILKERGEKG